MLQILLTAITAAARTSGVVAACLWMSLIGAGCTESAEPPAEPPVESPAPAAAPADGRLTPEGYVSDYFGFGLGFSQEWTAISMDELRRARAAAGPGATPLLYLYTDGRQTWIKMTAAPLEHRAPDLRALVDENARTFAEACGSSVSVKDTSFGGRAAIRFAGMCDGTFHQNVYIIERDHLITVRLTAANPRDIADADAVLSTATFF
jgi:hypothetical protein